MTSRTQSDEFYSAVKSVFPPPVDDTRMIQADEFEAWYGFLRVHDLVMRRLDNDLQTRHQIPLASFEVLLSLAVAPDRQLRMTELADRVVLSRSGVTRSIDRLVSAGLVERRPCVSDHRGSYAALTDAGLQMVQEVSGTHRAGVRAYALDLLGPVRTEQLRELVAGWLVGLEQR